VARARDEADARPIPYVLGSGEADEVALYGSIKPLLREVLPAAAVAQARARFEPLGLSVREAEHRVPQASASGTVLFVARDERLVAEAVRCEAAPDHDHELGRLLGYPRCCVEAYLEVPPPRRNVDVFAHALAASEACLPRLNVVDLAVFHYVSWLPCSFACALSKRYADAVASHIATKHGQFLVRGRKPDTTCPSGCRHERFVAAIDEAHRAHRLLITEQVQISLRGVFRHGLVHVERMWPTARDRHPEAALAVEAREAVARLVVRLEGVATVSVIDGVLYADERPVLRAPDAMLFPFEAPENSPGLKSGAPTARRSPPG